MVDMHTHILPGADHGSDSVEMSLSLIDAALSVGIDRIVATPHFYLSSGDSVSSFLKSRKWACERLLPALGDRADKFGLYLGAEVNLRLGLSEVDGLEKLCICGTNIMLLEMPFDKVWRDWVFNEVSFILDRHKIRPIIAHIDRYEPSQVDKLFDYFPLMAQINADCLMPFFRRRKILRYFDEGLVYALGSDVHRLEDAYVYYKKALNIIGKDRMNRVRARSSRILSDAVSVKL